MIISVLIGIAIFGFIIVRTLDDDGELTLLYGIILGVILFCFGFVYWDYKMNEYSCEKKAVAQGLEYKYGWFEGCLVKEPSEKNFIDYDRYRVMK
jgi:hypothetical protein